MCQFPIKCQKSMQQKYNKMSDTNAVEAHISLIDLSKQFAFDIDEELKQELCFGETLIVSCGHYEGPTEEEEEEPSESEWSCQETEPSGPPEETKQDEMIEIKDHVDEEEEPQPEPEEEHDFHFYFFPDCNKPRPPKNSKTSILTADGIPKINPAVMTFQFCTCGVDRKGNCTCHTKLPCKCGAKTKYECTCKDLEKICICNEHKPNVVCTCKGSKVCLCFPDSLPQPVCTCGQIEKPCVCYPDKFPSPVCKCKRKPKFGYLAGEKAFSEEMEWGETEEFETENGTESKKGSKDSAAKSESSDGPEEPCECQKPEPKKPCLCFKGKECTCNLDACICGIQKSCVCERTSDSQTEIVCKSDDSKSICSCPVPKECNCDAKGLDCKCFPKKGVCTCGTPENCTCFAKCDCTDPCICNTLHVKKECVCLDRPKQEGVECTCPLKDEVKKEEESKTLKKVRAGKHGYRWCHEVDSHHTYFDFAYGRHDKIDPKKQETEKFKILGLYDEKIDEDLCPVHEPKISRYEKKVRKPSIDCCSAVGGISICVESLGEGADKFLVQVVSHSSKEGAKTGTKLVSILDNNLHTMEENRVEYIINKDRTKERRSYMAICESGYYNKITRVCGERSVVKRRYYTFEQSRNFLLEGANVVLLRYFGLRRFKGTIKTDTVTMDGTICESVYVSKGVSQAVVNNTPLYVVKVERHIIDPNGHVHQTLTVLTLRGYIVSHEWADNNYMLHVNPLLRVNPIKDEIEQHAPLRENWRQDLQLHSDYLNFKSTRVAEGERYMAENGTLTATVRDYLQALLMLKPHDVLHFTRHYFHSTLSALDLPHDDYFDPCPKHVRYYYFEE